MRNKLFLSVVAFVLLVALGVCTVACGSSSPTTTAAAATGPIKVGHLLSLTGGDPVGTIQKAALKYAFDAVNNQVAGRPIEVVLGDEGSSATSAVDAARKMVEQDKVVAIFGPSEIGQKVAVAEYCKSVGIPLILYNPSPLATLTNNKWVIASEGTAEQGTSCMGDYLYTKLGYKTIVTITEDNSAGRAFMDPLTKVFTAEGGTVVKQDWVAENTADFTPYLTALPQADCLVAWETGSAAISLLTQWHQSGLYKKLPVAAAFHGAFFDPFIIGAMNAADAAAVVGSFASNTYAPDATDAVNQAFVAGMTPILGFPPGDEASAGPVQAVTLFLAAVTATKGDTTPEKLLGALTTASIVGPEGAESIGSGQQAATKNIYILKVEAVPNVKGAYHYVTIDTYKDVPPTGYAAK